MGSGSDEHRDLAEPLGAWLATQKVHLLNGGGAGVMTAVSRAFVGVPKRQGRVIGILPGWGRPGSGEPLPGYPNEWIEIPIRTHLPLRGTAGAGAQSRNPINVLSSDVIVALPGSAGTASEVALALRYRKPIIAWVRHRDDIPNLPSDVPVATSLEDVKEFVRRNLGQRSGRRKG